MKEEKPSMGKLLYDTQVLQIILLKDKKDELKELEQEFEDNKKEIQDEIEQIETELEETQTELERWNFKVMKANEEYDKKLALDK